MVLETPITFTCLDCQGRSSSNVPDRAREGAEIHTVHNPGHTMVLVTEVQP